MGRSFLSVRQGVNEVAGRWERVARDPACPNPSASHRLARMAKQHSSELFSAFDDPVESAVFSALVELLKETEEK